MRGCGPQRNHGPVGEITREAFILQGGCQYWNALTNSVTLSRLLNFCFLLCKMGIIIVTTSQAVGKTGCMNTRKALRKGPARHIVSVQYILATVMYNVPLKCRRKGIPWRSHGYNSALSLPRAQVQTLVGEVRSCKPRSQKVVEERLHTGGPLDEPCPLMSFTWLARVGPCSALNLNELLAFQNLEYFF